MSLPVLRGVPTRAPLRALAAGIALCGAASAPAAAGSITSNSLINFVETNQIYGGFTSNTAFPILPTIDPPALTLGAIVANIGAKVTADISFGVDGRFATFGGFSKYDLSYLSVYNTSASWAGADLTVGETFTLSSNALPLAANKLNINGQGFGAALQVVPDLHASLSATGCAGICGTLSFGINFTPAIEIAGINPPPGTGKLTVLGNEVGNLPATFSTPNGEVSVSGNLPNFSGTLQNVAPGTPFTYASTQKLGAATVNVAQIVADLTGFPFPLSGSLVGFDYTVLEAKLGMGVNLQHLLTVTPLRFETDFKFSSPVEIFDPATGQWGPPVMATRVESGETIEVRTADPAKTLGIVPTYRLVNHFEGDWNMLPSVFGGFRALELSGYGLDFGPLLEESVAKNLGTIDIDESDQERTVSTAGKAMTLNFTPLVATDDGQMLDLCASADCIATGFLAVTDDRGGGWQRDSIYLVPDLVPCLANPADCLIDPAFLPIVTDYRAASRGDGTELEFAPDRDELLRLLAMDLLEGGPESDEQAILDALRALGFDPDDPSIPSLIRRGLGDPDPPLAADTVIAFQFPVAEPGTLGLVAAGLAALAFARRRTRATRSAPSPA